MAKRLAYWTASLIALQLGSGVALAQTTTSGSAAPAPPPALPSDGEPSDQNEIVVVASYSKSLKSAQDTKRNATYSTDAVNAEDIGKFPAQNAAEAIQLVTGVTITRQRGEGLFVSVRGLGPRFQNVTLNGRTIAVNELIENGGAQGRSFRFEVLPAEFISQIEVIKTPTADMDDGAVGGNIDIKTFQPLDVGTLVTASARGNYNTLTEDATPTFSGLVSWANEDRTFGILATAMYAERKVRNDRFFGFGWNLDQFTGARGPLAAGLYTPARTRPTVELEDRKRISGALAVQWRPSSDLQTSIDVLYTKLDVDFDEYGIDIFPDDRTFRTPAFVAGSEQIIGDTVAAATINNVRWMASRETSLNRHELTAIGFNQSWTPGQWSFEIDGAYSEAHSFHPSLGEATLRSRIAFFGPLNYDYTRGFREIPTLTTDRSLTDPANFVGQAFDVAPKDSLDTDWAVQFDGSRSFDDGFVRKIAFGAQFQERNRVYDRRDFVLNGLLNVPVTTLGPDFLDPFPVTNFLANFPGTSPRVWLAPSRTAFFDRLFTPEVAAQPLTAGDLRNSFEVNEQISTIYGRVDFDSKIAALPFTGNVGLRFAETQQDASGHQTVGTAAEPVTFTKTYRNLLPSLNLRLELQDDLIARFAASRVVSRPNIVDVAPRLSISRDSPNGAGGNPNLDPFLATQVDLSLEWYFAEAGSLTGAVFYKKFDSFITRANSIIQVPGRGDISIASNVNGGDASLSGVELAYQQIFDFLPGPLRGLGVQASVTAVDVKANFSAGTRVLIDQLPGLSKLSYNVVGFYELGSLSTRLGYFWRDGFLNDPGSATAAPEFVDNFGSLDGQISYTINDNFNVFIEGINLTESVNFQFAETEIRGLEINNYGRTFTFGVRAKF